MKTASVIVLPWKKEIYQKWFIDKGLEFEIHETPAKELMFLVEYEHLNDFVAATESAIRECNSKS